MAVTAKDGMKAVGGYVTGANPITANAQTDVIAQINKFKALFPDPTSPRVQGHPDLNHLHPMTVGRIHVEIEDLIAKIDATAVA